MFKKTQKPKIIFFGNGPLSFAVWNSLKDDVETIFHAKTKEDLNEVRRVFADKSPDEKIYGVLASYGVMVPENILELFEPEGILNVHPSKLPLYRGSSPIETAILNGDKDFSVSVMKLVKKMDAGPIYFQTTLKNSNFLPFEETASSQSIETTPAKLEQSAYLPSKSAIYKALGSTGGTWIAKNLQNLPEPLTQDDSKATFTTKLDTSMAPLNPLKSTEELLNQVRAFEKFPKSRFTFFGVNCTILKAHIEDKETGLSIKCSDGKFLAIDFLQPDSRKPMDTKAFLNGYKK